MITKIQKIAEVLKQREEIEKEYQEIAMPAVTSSIEVALVYAAMTAAGIKKDAKLFIVLYLADPEALAGRKIKRGKRDMIATMFGYKSSGSITVKVRDLMFRYEHYKNFREEIERGHDIAERIFALNKEFNLHSDSENKSVARI